MRMVSLFSGAGGLDFGLQRAGHDIIWANDIFSDAAATYCLNVGAHIDTRDIRNVRSSEIPDCDVVVGGFPCQGFSVANWGRSTDDPRNQMYRQMVRVVPASIGVIDRGEREGPRSLGEGIILQRIIKDFEKIGYCVRHHVVNAADYGVPQLRRRLLIVGARKDQPDFTCFPPPTHADRAVAKMLGLKPWISVGAALRHLPEPEDGKLIPNHECSKYKLRFNGHLGHRFINPSRPAPTVTARGDERGGVVVLHHPEIVAE